jgi:hypothetical protein
MNGGPPDKVREGRPAQAGSTPLIDIDPSDRLSYFVSTDISIKV